MDQPANATGVLEYFIPRQGCLGSFDNFFGTPRSDPSSAQMGCVPRNLEAAGVCVVSSPRVYRAVHARDRCCFAFMSCSLSGELLMNKKQRDLVCRRRVFWMKGCPGDEHHVVTRPTKTSRRCNWVSNRPPDTNTVYRLSTQYRLHAGTNVPACRRHWVFQICFLRSGGRLL